MGARAHLRPRPRPGGSAGKYSVRRPRPSARLDDLKPVARPNFRVLGALQDVTDARPRQKETPGRHDANCPSHELLVQERDLDREGHPERVDGSRAYQQRFVPCQDRASEEPARPLAGCRGY